MKHFFDILFFKNDFTLKPVIISIKNHVNYQVLFSYFDLYNIKINGKNKFRTKNKNVGFI